MKTLLIAATLLLLPLAASRAADEKAAVQSAVEHYFSSWSARDMAAYEGAFHPDAVIFYCDANRAIERSPLQPFILSQKQAHEQSPVPLNEVPESIDIAQRGDFATALVHWKLTIGGTVKTGVDAFTMLKVGGQWKIVSLVFGSD